MTSKPLKYQDFFLELTDLKEDGTFTARVIQRAPGGEMRADEVERPTFNQDEFQLPLMKLEKRKNLKRGDLISLGKMLGSLMLPGKIGELFDKSLSVLEENEGLRLRLRIEPLALSALPWEFAFRSNKPGEEATDFLGLRPKISITRYETIGPAPKPFESKGKVRIVAALASPLDQDELQVEQDQLAIETALAALPQAYKERFELTVLEQATRASLIRELPGADIFQFSGHGVFEGAELNDDGSLLKRGMIILETKDNLSDRFESDKLAVLLQDNGTRLVVLGACNSASRDTGGAWTGVAPALARAEIPAVVAMQYKVGDTNAATFLATLYQLLLQGYSLDEAVQRGRQELFTYTSLEDRDWGVPVVYLRATDSFLFQRATAGATEPANIFVDQELGQVAGEVIGVRIRRMMGGQVQVREKIDRVEKGGKVTGVDLGDLFGAGDFDDFDEPRE